IANLFGLVNFSLREAEIEEIVGGLSAHQVNPCLSILMPILTFKEGQEDYRIYHESFRRYVSERIPETGGQIGEMLAPVIRWLSESNVFENEKSFVFLFPTLMKASKYKEIVDQVHFQYLTSSVQHGYCE